MRLERDIEIGAPVREVFACWTDYESLPSALENVRRIKCIGPRRVLWDVDVGGRQLVWEAVITGATPGKFVRWESCWGTLNSGEVRFEEAPGNRTRLHASIEFEPQGLIERLGARLGLVEAHVDRDLENFRYHVEQRSDAVEPHDLSAVEANGTDALR